MGFVQARSHSIWEWNTLSVSPYPTPWYGRKEKEEEREAGYIHALRRITACSRLHCLNSIEYDDEDDEDSNTNSIRWWRCLPIKRVCSGVRCIYNTLAYVYWFRVLIHIKPYVHAIVVVQVSRRCDAFQCVHYTRISGKTIVVCLVAGFITVELHVFIFLVFFVNSFFYICNTSK